MRAPAAVCMTLLLTASLCASLLFRCATPFAAFAVLAAAMLPPRGALLTIAAVWLLNQALGFGLLGYPWTMDALLWGLAIGTAAELATVMAAAVLARLRAMERLAVYPV